MISPFFISKELLESRPIIDVFVENQETLRKEQVRAMIDTGAEHCCIRKDFAKVMNLNPCRNTLSISGYVKTQRPVYKANIVFPNNLKVARQMTEFDIGSDFELILGMDIISRSDFSVTNTGERTIFSFTFPSQKLSADFKIL